MKTAKTISTILGVLFLSFSALAAFAQQPDWQKLTDDARAARQKGQSAEAATLYKQALEIQEKDLGPDCTEVATTLNNLAVVYQDESQNDKADWPEDDEAEDGDGDPAGFAKTVDTVNEGHRRTPCKCILHSHMLVISESQGAIRPSPRR